MIIQEKFGILYSATAIERQVQLHAEIILEHCRRQRIDDLHLLICLKGAMPYAADLARAISWQNRELGQIQHTVRISRYANETTGSLEFEITEAPTAEIRGKDVLIVEDIVDEGRTLEKLLELTWLHQPRSVAITAITEKIGAQVVSLPDRLTPPLPIKRNDDGLYPWVEGYGMDTEGRFRELDHIRFRIPH